MEDASKPHSTSSSGSGQSQSTDVDSVSGRLPWPAVGPGASRDRQERNTEPMDTRLISSHRHDTQVTQFTPPLKMELAKGSDMGGYESDPTLAYSHYNDISPLSSSAVLEEVTEAVTGGNHTNITASTTEFLTTDHSFLFPEQWNFSLNWTWDNSSFPEAEAAESGIEPYTLLGAIVTGLVLATIVIMTIIGNILVLLAVFVNSHLRGTTHYFIANLALADLLLGTTVLPFSASLEIIQYWAFGQIFCDIWAAVDVLCCTASILSLCVISIDRYIGVTRPLQHSTIMSEHRAAYIIISVWLLSGTISVAPLLGWKEPPPDDHTVCEVTKQLGYVLFSVSGSFYIPLIIILVVYFRVYREALSQSRFLHTGIKTARSDEQHSTVTLRIHTGGRHHNQTSPSKPHNAHKSPNSTCKPPAYQSSSSSEHSESSGRKNNAAKLTLAGKIAKFNREKKAAKTLGIVVGVFIICWFPFFFILPLGKSRDVVTSI